MARSFGRAGAFSENYDIKTWNRKTISRRGAEAQRMKGKEIGSLKVGTTRMKEDTTLCVKE
jgi:hypothetical protein